jgi:hypothetical protein
MARFYGEVGFGKPVQLSPGTGVTDIDIAERRYFGDVVRNNRILQEGDYATSNITVSNSISIVADDYAIEHFLEIKYVRWNGGLWAVSNVTVQAPRLVLDLGGVYNGPTP